MKAHKPLLAPCLGYLLTVLCFSCLGSLLHAQVTVNFELMQWHKVTLTQTAVSSLETTNSNPYKDYRMNVAFTAPSGTQYVVPGYFATDGAGGDVGKYKRTDL